MDGINLAWAIGITSAICFATGVAALRAGTEGYGAFASVMGLLGVILAVWIGAANGAFT